MSDIAPIASIPEYQKWKAQRVTKLPEVIDSLDTLKAFWLSNLTYLLMMFQSIPTKLIARELAFWAGSSHANGMADGKQFKEASCGMIACIGGWAAVMPRFHAMGVRAAEDGEICILKGSKVLAFTTYGLRDPDERLVYLRLSDAKPTYNLTYDSTRVAQALFGRGWGIFDPFDSADYSDKLMSARRTKEKAIARIEASIKTLRSGDNVLFSGWADRYDRKEIKPITLKEIMS